MRKKILLLPSIMFLLSVAVTAQQFNQEYIDSLIKSSAQAQVARTSKFVITGYTSVTAKINKADGAAFNNLVFNPIFLWQPHKNIVIEAEMETEIEGTETKIDMGYANASFFVNKYLTVRAGKFISPFGIFQDRLHPSWINKLPTVPVGTGEDELGVGPTSDIGIDVRGGIPLGSSKMNYSVFAANGAQLVTDPADPDKQGTLVYGSTETINKKLNLGGRVGLLPFSNSSLEIGFSYRNGNVGDRNSIYKSVRSQMYALDLIYVKQLDFIKGLFDVKAQWNKVNIDKADYIDPDGPIGGLMYTFDNKRNSVFAQAAYRPSMLAGKFLKKTELVFRYAGFNPPAGAKNLEEIKQYTYGINYWFTWRTAFKAAYQSQENNNALFLQVAVGF